MPDWVPSTYLRADPKRGRPLHWLAVGLGLLVACTSADRSSIHFESAPRTLTPESSRDPQLIVRASGAIALLAVQPASAGGEDLNLFMSPSGGDVFEKAAQVNALAGGVRSHGEGAPIFLEGPRGKFFAVWLGRRSESDRGNVLRVARSDDFLRSFAAPVIVDTGPGPGPAFFDATVAPDGTLIVAWLGRGSSKTIPGSSHLLISSSRDGGRNFEAPTTVAADICPCCQPGLAADAAGRWYLAWRKTDEENVRDLVLATSSDRGEVWSLGRTVPGPSWKIDGCPHSGPSLRVLGEELFVAWYTEATGESRIFWAKSPDGGKSFSAATDIAETILDPNHPQLGEADGRLFVTFQGRDPAAAGTWGNAQVFVREIGSDSPPVALPRGKGSASYPVLSGLGAGRMVVAWTDSTESGASVVAARGRVSPQ